jgi:hypothetical protein
MNTTELRSTPATSLRVGDKVSIPTSPDGLNETLTVERVTRLSRNQAQRAGLSTMMTWVEVTMAGHTETLCDADTLDVAVA